MEKKLNLKHLNIEDAPEESGKILQEVNNKMGMIPNLYKLMANNPGLLMGYSKAGEALQRLSGFNLREQQIVNLSVSYENKCHYCMAAHSFVGAKMAGLEETEVEALRNGERLDDDKLDALSKFTRAMVRERGWVEGKAVEEFLEAGWTKEHILGVVLAIGYKTMSNYFNHLAGTEVDEAFSDYKWEEAMAV